VPDIEADELENDELSFRDITEQDKEFLISHEYIDK
jgi:hypothetical protein